MSVRQPKYYQSEGISAIHYSLRKGIVNQLVVMPTGSGKTYTAAKAIIGLGNILWQTHLEELIEQSAVALLAELEIMEYNDLQWTIKNVGGLLQLLHLSKKSGSGITKLTENEIRITDLIGVVKAELFDIDKPIVVASVQTLWRRLDRIPSDHFAVVVADEAHRFGANTYQACLNHFNAKLRLGLTATPFREDNMLIGDIFDEIVYEYPIDKAIADGYLTKPNAIQVRTSVDLTKVHSAGGDFKTGELTEKINTLERNNLIVSKYLEYANGRQFIAFCVDVQHAQDLCEHFQERGINCDFIVGDKKLTTDRRGVIDRFKDGETSGLINVMVLTEGFDHANTGCIILACPTQSRTKFLQSLGRGLRLKDDAFVAMFGQNCVILDIVDNTVKHKLINTITFDKELPLEKKIFITDHNRQLLLNVKAARENVMLVNQRQEDVLVDLLQLPKLKVNNSIRMQEPATEKQLERIAKLGYDIVNTHYSKKHCSDIISAQPASDKQISFLKWRGYDVTDGVTVGEAEAAFLEVKKREAKEKAKQQSKGFELPFGL